MIRYEQLPKQATIVEVGPRDGLQNEPEFIPTDKKIEFVNLLTAAGCKKIEVTSFVHPKWVPQMRDARDLFAKIEKKDGVAYSALIPNMKGLELAVEAGLKEVVTILSASESHNKKNTNMSVPRSLEEHQAINKLAQKQGIKVRSYIGTSFGCPMEGEVPTAKVADIAVALEENGTYEISLGDTTGMANPLSAYELARLVLGRLAKASLGVHYHRCGGMELANNLASMQAGVTVFDGAAGGLGGCPYAPGATGNCATEILVEMFGRMGIETGLSPQKITQCGQYAKKLSTVCVSRKERESGKQMINFA